MAKSTNEFRRYDLVDRVLDALPQIGYTKATPVQHKVIPLILQRRNLLVEAATGTGKTAAYGLPLLSRIELTRRKTQALVLVPSRELALQVEAALRSFCTHEQYRVHAIYGGEDMQASETKLRSGAQVLVAVPGRLKDVLRLGKSDAFWRDIKYLVIDEADKLLEQGFQDIFDNLISNVRNTVQVALFSATISSDAELLIRERFAPISTIRLSPKEALHNIEFHYVHVDKGQKPRYLAGLLQTRRVRQGLIFCSKREEVYELANFLRSVGRKSESYHGLLDQVEREAIMNRFKNKQVEFLVATDLAARGLDVQDLPAVVNYSFPDNLEVYLHRCGRTGRAGKQGKVFDLVSSSKEEIVVKGFHTELDIPIKALDVKPVDKELISTAHVKIVKVHINRGKTDKLRSGDVVGFLTQQVGVPADSVGTIAVYDTYTIVDIPATFEEMLEGLETPKIKGKTIRISRYTLADAKAKSEAVRKSQIGVRDKKELAKAAQRKEQPGPVKKVNTPHKPLKVTKDPLATAPTRGEKAKSISAKSKPDRKGGGLPPSKPKSNSTNKGAKR
jgi:ATP-independent RNA helicase DbpA